MKKIYKKLVMVVIIALVLMVPNLKASAMDIDHVKIGVAEIGKCYTTTYDTFNHLIFLLKHPEIGYCDKETAWAYYEMYCKPNGELAPCTLKAYMTYKEFDVEYFLAANGLTRAGATDEELFNYYCEYYFINGWAARGLTDHATALIKAYEYFWMYYYTGAEQLYIMLNFYAVPSAVAEYYTVDPYADPYTWDIITSIDGPMLYGLGNCQSYANFYMFLMDMSGIPSRTVVSETHMWNEVLYNGSWFACDTCWADAALNHTNAVADWFMVTYN